MSAPITQCLIWHYIDIQNINVLIQRLSNVWTSTSVTPINRLQTDSEPTSFWTTTLLTPSRLTLDRHKSDEEWHCLKWSRIGQFGVGIVTSFFICEEDICNPARLASNRLQTDVVSKILNAVMSIRYRSRWCYWGICCTTNPTLNRITIGHWTWWRYLSGSVVGLISVSLVWLGLSSNLVFTIENAIHYLLFPTALRINCISVFVICWQARIPSRTL